MLAVESKDQIHFLIPAGPGGGWDSTARAVGLALDQEESLNASPSKTYQEAVAGGRWRNLLRTLTATGMH